LTSHLALAIPAIVLSLVISIPIGWLAHQYRWSHWWVVTLSGLIYAIPSLPLLVALPTLLGTQVRDDANVVAALTLYGIALMVRSVADALDDVPPGPVISAQAMGFSPAARFLRVQLPLAGPSLLAGLRVVTVSTVALVTVSAVLGTPSLGQLFTDGFQRGIMAEVVTGLVGTAVVALGLDGLLLGAGRLLMPWTSAHRNTGGRA
jgi:osmoprotectant transport system permease protein